MTCREERKPLDQLFVDASDSTPVDKASGLIDGGAIAVVRVQVMLTLDSLARIGTSVCASPSNALSSVVRFYSGVVASTFAIGAARQYRHRPSLCRRRARNAVRGHGNQRIPEAEEVLGSHGLCNAVVATHWYGAAHSCNAIVPPGQIPAYSHLCMLTA